METPKLREKHAGLPKPKPETLIEEINVVCLTSLRKDIIAPSKLQKKNLPLW